MIHFARLYSVSLAALAALSTSFSAVADDATARELFTQGQAKFADRGTAGAIDDAIHVLEQALKAADDPALKFDILTLASRSYYYKGSQASGSEAKLPLFQSGMDKAAAARAINKDVADAHYWYAINLGVWAQARGIIESLGRKNELLASLREAITRKSKAGEPEGTIDGHGPYRALGRLYFKLPAPVGGSHVKSLEFLRKAANGSPQNALNILYLAETLADGPAGERAEAKLLLSEAVKKSPNDFDPNRLPETTEELAKMRELLKELGGA